MGYQTVMTDVQQVGVGAVVDVRPPLNQVWKLTLVGCNRWAGVVPNQVPQVDVALFDGTLQAEFMWAVNVRGWYRPLHIFIDRTNYARLTNASGLAATNISFSAELLHFSSGDSVVASDLQTVGVGATWSIQPGVTEDWRIHDIGSDQWVGAAPAGIPNVTVELNDGTNAAMMLSPTEARMWEPEIELYVNNGTFLDITNSSAAIAILCWSGEMIRRYGTGFSIVMSAIQVAGAGAAVDFRPAVGREWRVTMIGASAWVGISPAMFPNIQADIFDGTLASRIETPNNWMLNGHKSQLVIDRDDYLRVTDALGTGLNVGVSAELIQMYA